MIIDCNINKPITQTRGCGKTFTILNYNMAIVASYVLEEPVELLEFLIYKGIESERIIDMNCN
jgi:hypothetical protein